MKVRKYRLRFKKNYSEMIIPILLWTIMMMISLGMLIPFFMLYFFRELINNTVIELDSSFE